MPLAFRRSRARYWLLALASIGALLAAAALALQQAPTARAQTPDAAQLVLSLVNDSDNIVPAGSELTVRAQLRYSGTAEIGGWMNITSGSNLRLSGSLDWDDASVVGSRNDIDAQLIGGPKTALIPMAGSPLAAYDINSYQGGSHQGAYPVAYDSRTLVARSGRFGAMATAGTLHIFNLKTNPPKQAATIAGTTGERLGTHSTATTHGNPVPGGPTAVRPVAVWDENATTAWLFAGAPATGTNVGRLYIYKITYAANGDATVGTPTQLNPPMAEYTNRLAATDVPNYGQAVSISDDGQTLAVGAPDMNSFGAVYVYTMPDGAGEDWSDLEYDDGVKVTAVQIPSWGTSSSRPFPASLTSSNCAADSYCGRANANKDALFGTKLELSADGNTLVVTLASKSNADSTAGNALVSGTRRGSVKIFTAPTGGWSAVPEASGTLLAADSSTAFVATTHKSPGPDKRVESAAAELTPVAWSETRSDEQNFGHQAHISADGSTVVVGALNGGDGSTSSQVFVYERPDDGTWVDDSSPDATISIGTTGTTVEGAYGIDVNYNGGRVLFEKQDATVGTVTRAGVVYVFEPNSGGWAAQDSTDDDTANPDGIYVVGDAVRTITAPTPTQDAFFAAPLYNNAGTLIAWADTDYWAVDYLTPNPAPKIYASADICTARTLDALTTTTCTLDLGDTSVTVPAGTPDGTFTISGRVNATFSDGTAIANGARGSLEVTIGKVKEVDSATLALATDPGNAEVTGDEKPYPALLRTSGETTRLLLRILNENGAASHAGSVAAVLVTSNAGELGLLDSNLRGDDCGGISCQLDATKINAGNADRLVITLAHQGKAATAEVRATVFSTAGDSFETAPVSVALAGPADSIAVASTTSGVLNVDAVGTDADGEEIDSEDTRDELTLAVTATDSAGNDVALPTGARRTNVLDPDGKRVAASAIQVVWPHRADPNSPATGATAATPNVPILNAAGKQQVRINVNSPSTAPLKSGEYTLELWAGVKKAERTFNVSGGATEISLSGPASVTVGETFTVTASFQDASGTAVPNGTMVDWPEIVTATGTGQLVVLSSKDTRTTDGEASASWLAVNTGSVVVTAGADCTSALNAQGASVATCSVSGVQLVNVQAVATAAASTNPADDLTERNPGALSVWLGSGRTSAGELLSNLPGVNGILLWLNGQWVRYGVADGREIPGSTNFEVNPGSVLWLSR